MKKWLPKLAHGEWIGAWGLTEHNTGSDAGGMSTTAKLDGDHYVLNGAKNFITHGISGDIAVVIVRTGEKGGETFFSGSPWLYLTILPAFGAAIAAGVGAMWAVMRRGERSILVILPLVFGALALVFAVGEMAGGE